MELERPNLYRVRRMSAGLTVSQLALRLQVSRTLVASWEKGDGDPGPKLIPRLAAAYGVPAESLSLQMEEKRIREMAARPTGRRRQPVPA